jgi:hypothetical protein
MTVVSCKRINFCQIFPCETKIIPVFRISVVQHPPLPICEALAKGKSSAVGKSPPRVWKSCRRRATPPLRAGRSGQQKSAPSTTVTPSTNERSVARLAIRRRSRRPLAWSLFADKPRSSPTSRWTPPRAQIAQAYELAYPTIHHPPEDSSEKSTEIAGRNPSCLRGGTQEAVGEMGNGERDEGGRTGTNRPHHSTRQRGRSGSRLSVSGRSSPRRAIRHVPTGSDGHKSSARFDRWHPSTI